MVYLLATPNTRAKIIVTQAIYLLASIFVLVAIATATGIVYSSQMFPGELDIAKFLL